MAYTIDMEEAAGRHYHDGCKLLKDNRLDNAGYHFGLAAECAIKGLLQLMGVRDDEDVMRVHFPIMRGLALQVIGGRSATAIRSILERDNFLQRWDIRMRYATNGNVDSRTADTWRNNANEVIGLLL